MGKYSDYNIIPIGDHCAIGIILKELNLRKKSYPFDWVTKKDELYDTNIMYNSSLIDILKTYNIDDLVSMYIGDAFNNEKMNTNTTICFPHDTESIDEIFEKYKRRFIRLKEDLTQKNIFILVTRNYYIEEKLFQTIRKQLLQYNRESIILFISGKNHSYVENISNVIFKHIEYDISKFYSYDYSDFRPKIKSFLSELFS